MIQMQLHFSDNKSFGGQLSRLYELLCERKVTCEDAPSLGIAGSAFARRIKDLKSKYNLNIITRKVDYTRSFDGKVVKLSQYELIK